ncbi:MAG: VOC family protein [Planctomycetes bacterium]|nr:VOC family protein [Planctomycetota bacterium]
MSEPRDDRRPALRAEGGGPRPFHLALPVHDLGEAEGFYVGLLGAGVGRRSDRWIDFDLGGHQITVHLVPGASLDPGAGANPVDGDQVPIPHFGIVLTMGAWEALAASLQESGCDFVIPPRVRFRGQAGEQGTLFLRDPSGNALEFKGFREAEGLFDETGAY